MAVVKVEKKNAEIDGRPIEWNVLNITGFLGGDFQTLEVKLDRTQAMLAGMLLATDEGKPEVNGRKATAQEEEDYSKNNRFLDD